MCLVIASVGKFDPLYVENEMGFPEMQIRFLDCLKIIKRQQQLQAMTLVGAVGSFLVSKGQKTMFEEIEIEIEKIASLTDGANETRSPEEDKIRQAKKLKDAYELREAFMQSRKNNKIQGKEI